MSNRRSSRRNVENEVDTIETKAIQCAKLFLCKEGSKIPIKKVDIREHLNTNLNFLSIINRAKEKLKNIYGYNIMEIKKGYIVVLDKECIGEASSPDPHQRILLNAALTHIYMSGGQVSEDNLSKFLQLAELIKNNNNNNLEWKKMFNLFVKQQYLDKGKGDNDNVVCRWGERAEIEVPKMFIIKKMSEALDKNHQYWGEQYRIAEKQEKQSQQLQES